MVTAVYLWAEAVALLASGSTRTSKLPSGRTKPIMHMLLWLRNNKPSNAAAKAFSLRTVYPCCRPNMRINLDVVQCASIEGTDCANGTLCNEEKQHNVPLLKAHHSSKHECSCYPCEAQSQQPHASSPQATYTASAPWGQTTRVGRPRARAATHSQRAHHSAESPAQPQHIGGCT